MVEEIPILSAHIEGTIRAIAKLHADHREEAGRLQQLIERLTAWIGLPQFIAALTVVIELGPSATSDTGVRKSALG
jgi:hypothetical protein